MALRDKYVGLLDTAASSVKNLDVKEEGGKLRLKGQTPHQLEKNLVWDKIKTYPDWEKEIAADLKVEDTSIFGVHTVKSGDTLSALAKAYLGDAKRYPEIFKANQDVLSNPDLIKVGQRLKIPNA